MKVIAIFRKAFKPTPQPEVTDVLLNKIYEQSQIPPMAFPSPFGVISYLTTSKNLSEITRILAMDLPDHEFEIFEVPCDQLESSGSASNDYSTATMDELLDLIGQVGGVEQLPEAAKQRLNQLRGEQ